LLREVEATVAILPKRQIGTTPVEVTEFGFGGTGLGNIFAVVPEDDAVATIRAALAAGIRYFDTAPLYGHGLSELRTGAALRLARPERLTISTKVGWRLTPSRQDQVTPAGVFAEVPPFECQPDYGYDAVMREVEDSLQRLGVNRVDILFIHDVDHRNKGADYRRTFDAAMKGAYRALTALREEGVVKALGVGVNEWQPCQEFAEAAPFDCFLLAGRYTLLEQESLDSFLPLCVARKMSVIIGGPFNSGILATGPIEGATYDYKPAPQPILERVARIEAVCRRHGVPLAAAALQFPLHHPAIAAIIPGGRRPDEIEVNLRHYRHLIPAQLWHELKAEGLLRQEAPTP
jgi:D-threo-aldose 1-dehydrogenase